MEQVGLFEKKAASAVVGGDFRFFKILKIVQEADAEYTAGSPISSPLSAVDMIRERVSDYAYEVFGVLLLDNKHKPTGWGIVGQGSIDQCPASPREVFTPALLSGAGAVIVFHNHPSGDPKPSQADIKLTHALAEAGKHLGVRVLDHIIVGGSSEEYFSFASNNMMTKEGF